MGNGDTTKQPPLRWALPCVVAIGTNRLLSAFKAMLRKLMLSPKLPLCHPCFTPVRFLFCTCATPGTPSSPPCATLGLHLPSHWETPEQPMGLPQATLEPPLCSPGPLPCCACSTVLPLLCCACCAVPAVLPLPCCPWVYQVIPRAAPQSQAARQNGRQPGTVYLFRCSMFTISESVLHCQATAGHSRMPRSASSALSILLPSMPRHLFCVLHLYAAV